MLLVSCMLSFLDVLYNTASSLFHSDVASFAGTGSWNAPDTFLQPPLCSQGNHAVRCSWNFKDMSKLNELLYCKYQTDMDFGHLLEWKLAYRPSALGNRVSEDGHLKQIILSDVSPFWIMPGCKLCCFFFCFQDLHCKLWRSKQTWERQVKLPVPSV